MWVICPGPIGPDCHDAAYPPLGLYLRPDLVRCSLVGSSSVVCFFSLVFCTNMKLVEDGISR